MLLEKRKVAFHLILSIFRILSLEINIGLREC